MEVWNPAIRLVKVCEIDRRRSKLGNATIDVVILFGQTLGRPNFAVLYIHFDLTRTISCRIMRCGIREDDLYATACSFLVFVGLTVKIVNVVPKQALDSDLISQITASLLSHDQILLLSSEDTMFWVDIMVIVLLSVNSFKCGFDGYHLIYKACAYFEFSGPLLLLDSFPPKVDFHERMGPGTT